MKQCSVIYEIKSQKLTKQEVEQLHQSFSQFDQ